MKLWELVVRRAPWPWEVCATSPVCSTSCNVHQGSGLWQQDVRLEAQKYDRRSWQGLEANGMNWKNMTTTEAAARARNVL